MESGDILPIRMMDTDLTRQRQRSLDAVLSGTYHGCGNPNPDIPVRPKVGLPQLGGKVHDKALQRGLFPSDQHFIG